MKKAFSLAEVMVAMGVLGIVAACTIPSVVASITQQEYKSGLRKAVSVLNQAITTGTSLDGDTPQTNKNLFEYLKTYMTVLKSTDELPWSAGYRGHDGTVFTASGNAAFYTTDGMRFEFLNARTSAGTGGKLRLHESSNSACMASAKNLRDFSTTEIEEKGVTECGGCGSFGLQNDPNETGKVPCAVLVDVNGDRKPTPNFQGDGVEPYIAAPLDKPRLNDVFIVLITESRAIPYGVIAQKTMYSSRK